MKEISYSATKWVAMALAGVLLLTSACSNSDNGTNNGPTITPDGKVIPQESTFFSTVRLEPSSTYPTFSDGDLWPVAWSDDDHLYSVNGDGKGFDYSMDWADIVANRITGTPSDQSLDGVRLAEGDKVARVWSDPARYNRKPTGIVSVDGTLYLAVQDLNKDDSGGGNAGSDIFNEAPAASIYKSTDKGTTWTHAGDSPMFKDHVFTTIMFLDYGKDGANNTFDDYMYAYGMDHNWRDSFNDVVTDPTKLFLARMPKDRIQDSSAWEYYAGDLNGKAKWTDPGDIAGRQPVLQDDRRVYTDRLSEGLGNLSVISQGSIVYNKPLNRYLYTSWTEFTFEFYEAPKPWGPWKKFYSADFGDYPWTQDKYGGYATVIPSKFISEDGQEMWVQSNTFMGRVNNYNFSLRKLTVTPYEKTKANNKKSNDNLASPSYNPDIAPVSRTLGNGGLALLNDGTADQSLDSFNGERKTEDWWGYAWPQAYRMNKVVFKAGQTDSDEGGWFADVKVQVRQNFKWVDVEGATVSPAYPADASAADGTFTFAFKDTSGDGVRIVGKPGGESAYTSIGELEVYYSE